MKKYLSVLILFIFILSFSFPALAEEIPENRLCERLVDEAELLDQSQEDELLLKLDEISQRQGFDVVIATVNSLGAKTPEEFADDYFDYNGFGFGEERDGILFLISMQERDWAILPFGYGIEVFNNDGREYIANQIVPYLSDGDYMQAFTEFAQLSDDFITQAKTNQPYDSGNLYDDEYYDGGDYYSNNYYDYSYKAQQKGLYHWLKAALICLAIGIVIAFFVTHKMKNDLKSVRLEQSAGNYIRPNSFKVTGSRDMFLYKNVTRTPRPKENQHNNNHHGGPSFGGTSSSGTSNRGSSGKF